MSLVATVRAMVAAGATGEVILAVVEAWELEHPEPTGRLRWFDATYVREQVLSRDGEVCTYCADRSGPFEIDHIVPLIKDGSNDLDNLTVACRPCNRSKGGRLLSEWGGRKCR